jgi:regulator of protease activity HflC (stomatin/prohibitin superfamily)
VSEPVHIPSLFRNKDSTAAPTPEPERDSALSASLRTAFRFLTAVVGVLALAWLGSGVRPVEPGMQAVIFRTGAIERTVGSGLALAWPKPFEEVVLVPGPDRQLTLDVTRLDLTSRGANGALGVSAGTGLDPRVDGGFALTGDAGVVHLRGSVAYTVTDPRAYVVARDLVEPALTRAVLAATIAACAGRSLDGVMVASPDGQDAERSESLAQSRERLRGDIVTDANRRLAALGLGVAVGRIDLTAYLPDRARPSFDAVVAAEGSAAKEIAEARTAATRLQQESDAQRAAILTAATAKSQETLTAARVATDRIRAVLAEDSPERRTLLISRLYQERIEAIIAHAGGVVSVPPGEDAKIWVPGR